MPVVVPLRFKKCSEQIVVLPGQWNRSWFEYPPCLPHTSHLSEQTCVLHSAVLSIIFCFVARTLDDYVWANCQAWLIATLPCCVSCYFIWCQRLRIWQPKLMEKLDVVVLAVSSIWFQFSPQLLWLTSDVDLGIEVASPKYSHNKATASHSICFIYYEAPLIWLVSCQVSRVLVCLCFKNRTLVLA